MAPPDLSLRRPRSLLPREHGAYGQLGLPLVTGLALGRLTLAAVALVVGFAAAFVAHESLLVLVGHRGGRARREDGPRAGRHLAALASLAVGATVVGVRAGGRAVGLALLAPLAFALALAPLIARRRERTAVGEVLAATALSATALPVALASGASGSAALTATAVWALGFAVVTVAIRGVLAASRGAPAGLFGRAVPAALTLAAAVALAARGHVAAGLALGLAPLCALAVLLAAAPPPASRIKAVGWGVVAAGVTTLGLLAATLR
jgi:hypothetical protein